ncbi:hypothetical protein [Exiguobacterium sp. s189]|uniref:hypothetical protein n=1 Tax=Exiguobacterium sp. s189 TaxID=2751263 RepID=UPI001BECB170|nr:hypothetical protein [Exiguobacterium sp. s189]
MRQVKHQVLTVLKKLFLNKNKDEISLEIEEFFIDEKSGDAILVGHVHGRNCAELSYHFYISSRQSAQRIQFEHLNRQELISIFGVQNFKSFIVKIPLSNIKVAPPCDFFLEAISLKKWSYFKKKIIIKKSLLKNFTVDQLDMLSNIFTISPNAIQDLNQSYKEKLEKNIARKVIFTK